MNDLEKMVSKYKLHIRRLNHELKVLRGRVDHHLKCDYDSHDGYDCEHVNSNSWKETDEDSLSSDYSLTD